MAAAPLALAEVRKIGLQGHKVYPWLELIMVPLPKPDGEATFRTQPPINRRMTKFDHPLLLASMSMALQPNHGTV